MGEADQIVDKIGAEFVGAFPDELLNYAGVNVGIPANVVPSDGVTALVKFLTSRTAIAAMQAKGMQVE